MPAQPLSQPPYILIIAYGNLLRRDDGAGLALAARLAQQWQSCGLSVEQITTHQLVPELAAEIADSSATHVVFVDTTPAAIAAEIQIRALDAPQATPQATMTLGHQCSPDVLIYMVRQLYNVQVPAWLMTIPGTDFGHGVGFGEEVEELLAKSECIAVKMLGELGQ